MLGFAQCTHSHTEVQNTPARAALTKNRLAKVYPRRHVVLIQRRIARICYTPVVQVSGREKREKARAARQDLVRGWFDHVDFAVGPWAAFAHRACMTCGGSSSLMRVRRTAKLDMLWLA